MYNYLYMSSNYKKDFDTYEKEISNIKESDKEGTLNLMQYFHYNSFSNKDYHFTSRILSKNVIKVFFEKYLEIILKKWWRAIWEQNIEYYMSIINKFLNQEEWELLKWKKIKEINNPMKYSEFQDFCYIVNTLSSLKLKDFDDTSKKDSAEKERIIWIIGTIDRMFSIRQENWTHQNLFDPNVEVLKNMQLIRSKTISIILNYEDETIESNPNKDLVWPKDEYEKRLDKYFKHLFFICSNKTSNKNSYYRNLYHRITTYNENTKITLEELWIFIEFINELDIDVFGHEKTWDIMSIEEIAKIFKKWINNWFLNYILPKIFKIRVNELCKKQNEKIINWEKWWLMYEISEILKKDGANTKYSLKSQLNIETTRIYEWVEIYSIWEKHYRMNYLVKNWKIIAEFKWYDKENINEHYGRKIVRIMHKNRYANIYLNDWETIWWWFDDVSKLEDWVDWDKVFKVVFEQKNENYISMRKWKTITPYPWYFLVSDIRNMPFGEKYFEYNIITTNIGWVYMELSLKAVKKNLRTWEEVNLLELTQFELKRRLNTLLMYLW